MVQTGKMAKTTRHFRNRIAEVAVVDAVVVVVVVVFVVDRLYRVV